MTTGFLLFRGEIISVTITFSNWMFRIRLHELLSELLTLPWPARSRQNAYPGSREKRSCVLETLAGY
jgi:hypothetical protein